QVNAHNEANYESFSTLVRATFSAALDRFGPESIEVLHVDGLHTEDSVRRDLELWLPKLRPGRILLLHDVNVRTRDFGVWKVWDELKNRGRSWTFHDGPGLGVWEKPPAADLPELLESLFQPPNEQNRALVEYYSERAAGLQEKIAQQWREGTIRNSPFAQQTVIQVFHSSDGSHREEDSVYARIGHEGWKDVRIDLPAGMRAAPLRIDFVSAFTTIEIESISIMSENAICFRADNPSAFDAIAVRGDAQRLPDEQVFRLKITGVDPQLYLPDIETAGTSRLSLEMRLRVT
ncbi:MAG: class I SAM-dependent methyltransferase, partial [Chthoniobacterales bacterium]